MKNPIENLNKTFDSRIRLGIMSAIMVNASINFNDLKELINVTDGNLASHINALEKEKYIKVKKRFIGKKTRTTYSMCGKGKKAFEDHLNTLEIFIKESFNSQTL